MRYNTIKLNDIANTDNGINISIFTQGCPHHCEECFNKETWTFNAGKEYISKTFEYICSNIDSYGVKRDLSLLGGEPLCEQNIESVIQLCKDFKNKYPHKKIYIWTGYTIENFNETQRKVLQYTDVLIDGKFEKDKKDLSLKLRGSYNQRVISVQESIKKNKVVLYSY